MGALRVHAGRVANAANSSSANLIIDPGYNTFDWLMASGMRADLERSGSFGGGVSHILKEVSHQTGMALGVGTLDMIECEEALESGVLVAGAKNYDFTPFRAVAEGVADDVIDRFINALNFNRRFSQIIMTGGGAKFYANALRKRFP